jgi:hypothetical protein
MQQVRVKVWNKVFDRFEYLFESKKAIWEPVFDKEAAIRPQLSDGELLRLLKLVPPEDSDWFPVCGLSSAEPTGNDAYQKALRESAPESGSFILFSLRRRKRFEPTRG